MSTLRERKKEQFQPKEDKSFYQLVPEMPKLMMVELSNGCNHACLFCANTNMKRKVGRISDELMERIMTQAREAGVHEVGFFTTGEPFIHKGLTKYTALAHDLGYEYIYITTNGVLATPDRVTKLIGAGLNSIKFSVNAGSRETYKVVHGKDDFDTVVENIKFISEYRKTLDRPLSLYVGMVVTEQTRDEVEALQELLGPYVDDLLPVMSHDQYGQMNGAEDVLMANEHDRRKGICTLPFNRLHVSCEGYLTLCCVDYHNYLAVCDLNEMSVVDAWKSPEFQEMRRRHIEAELDGTLCASCWYGSKEKVHPLEPKFATLIDFDDFHEESSKIVAERIKQS